MPEENSVSAESKIPYLNAYGNITRVLQKIKEAATPPRFSQDFLGSKLGLTGGSAKPLIPFLKRIGFLGSDGTPTDWYKQFRNETHSGRIAGQALNKGFHALFEVNEYAHEANDADLKGIIVQVTGLEGSSSTAKAILGSFKALKAFASFDNIEEPAEQEEEKETEQRSPEKSKDTNGLVNGLNLGYTINLHLPPTSDIAVFDAIFKSLNEHLMKGPKGK